MLKIGEFSKLSRVSVRMLRHYDDIGLLTPAVVCRITALRDMGFPLAEVRALLPVYGDPEALDVRLAQRQRELEAQREAVSQQLRLLDSARRRLRKEESMNYNVTIRTLPERYAATCRMTIPCYEEERLVWHVLCKETDHLPLTPSDPCYCCVTFLDGEFKERDVTVEAQKTVKGRYADTEHVKFRTLPAVTAALTAWIEANGYAYDGPMFDIYHVSPHETDDPAQFVTEVCYPVRKK